MTNFDEVTAGLQKFLNYAKAPILKIFAFEWEKSVRKNFEVSGRPAKWTPRKRISKKQRGRKILVISGRLKNYRATINESEGKVMLVADPAARDYARIHNEGGVINVPARTKKFRTGIKTKSGKNKSVFASSKHKRVEEKTIKAHTIEIPKREHTNIPQEDIPKWVSTIKAFFKLK